MKFFKNKKNENDWEIDESEFSSYESDISPFDDMDNSPRFSFKDKLNFRHDNSELYDDLNDLNNFNDLNDIDYFDDTPSFFEENPIYKIVVIVGLVILSFFGFMGWGYWNTDFDSNGQAYVVSLEIHKERKYISESDEVLQTLVDIHQMLPKQSEQLPKDYLKIANQMQSELNILKEQTNKFSKYVNVPDKFANYHSSLINFSIKTQNFINKLLNNYSDPNYENFRKKGIEDYNTMYKNIEIARKDIDKVVFRNVLEKK